VISRITPPPETALRGIKHNFSAEAMSFNN
jgi:hypothetical protein